MLHQDRTLLTLILGLSLIRWGTCEHLVAEEGSPPTQDNDSPSRLEVPADGELKALVNVAFDGTRWRAVLGERDGRWVLADASGSLKPVLDFDGDGIADYARIESTSTAEQCDDGNLVEVRVLSLYSGLSQKKLLYRSDPIPDSCVLTNGVATNRAVCLHYGAIQYGPRPGEFALSPQYYESGWFVKGANSDSYYNPNTDDFASYTAARPMLQPSAEGRTYQWGAQPFNGLLISDETGSKYLATTSGRFLLYMVGPHSASQLLQDVPFLARPDLVGRNYGLLMHDSSGNAQKAFLISGTSTYDLFLDVEQDYGSRSLSGGDVWGAIERHVSVYDMSTATVNQKFYSYAHDNEHGDTYRGRIAYPSHALLPSPSKEGSRMIYNVFDGSTWSIHITEPGNVETHHVLKDYYVWDVVRRAGGQVDVVVSPVDVENTIMIPDRMSVTGVAESWRSGRYFPKMETQILSWDAASATTVHSKTIEGGIPYLGIPFAHTATEGNGTGYLFSSQRGYDHESGRVVLIMYGSDRQVFAAGYLPD